ncbi:MAG: hypothetical protein AAF533_18835 [Acidobacteriota bacterium]
MTAAAPPPPPPAPDREDQLPFDVRTLVLGLWKWRWWMLACFGLSAAVGVLAALFLGVRVYKAETVLLYRPDLEVPHGVRAPSLPTQSHLVELQATLEDTRKRLQLPIDLLSLKGATDVNIARDTDLMVIKVKWTDPKMAALVANTIRQSFIKHQQSMRMKELTDRIRDLERGLTAVRSQLSRAEEEEQRFKEEHGVINLEAEEMVLVQDLVGTDNLLREARSNRRALNRQDEILDRRVGELRREMEEADRSGVFAEGFSNLNSRLKLLDEKIEEDQDFRANQARLGKLEADYERNLRLFEQGLVSKEKLEDVEANLERQRAVTVDTNQTAGWKNEREEIQGALQRFGGGKTPIGLLLEEQYQLQLRSIALDERIGYLEATASRLRERETQLPPLAQLFSQITREVQARAVELARIEGDLVVARRTRESLPTDFTVVAEAQPPDQPTRSNRRVLAMAVTMGGVLLTLTCFALREILDARIRSTRELSLKLNLPILGVTPDLSDGAQILPGKYDTPLLEGFRRLSKRIRHTVPREGARILITSSRRGEGRTTAALNLAACWGREGERVVMVDARVRSLPEAEMDSGEDPRSLAKASMASEDLRDVAVHALIGLGEYLSSDSISVDSILWPTSLPGVTIIPRVGRAKMADLLWSSRMEELLDELSRRFSIILIDAPPVLRGVDAEALSRWVDGVVFVVRASQERTPVVREALTRLQALDSPILGALLNGVENVYLTGMQKL